MAKLGGCRLGSALLGAIALCACSDAGPFTSPSEPREPIEPIDSEQQAFSTFGIERVIPLRIVMMANDCRDAYHDPDWTPGEAIPSWKPCSTCTDGNPNCGPDTANYDQIRTGVAQANHSLKSLGVQFYISRIEKHLMPTFFHTHVDLDNYLVRWDLVHPQLQRVYPTLYSGLFDPTKLKTEHNWIQTVAIRAGEPREIIVWVAERSYGCDGVRVGWGASSLNCDRWMFDPHVLAHELGHIVGLEHSMYPANTRDPEQEGDLAWTNKSDFWDLYFGYQATPETFTYFSTRADAAAWNPNFLVAKHRWDPAPGDTQNCAVDANCTLRCCFTGSANDPVNPDGTCARAYGDNVTIGDPEIAGLGFTFAGDNPGGGVYQRGINPMIYQGGGGKNWNWNCPWKGFSNSQAEHVKKVLRSDVRIAAGGPPNNEPDWEAPFSAGYTSERYMLGDYSNVSGFDQLDFDGDGKRDIAVWAPPNTPGAPYPPYGRLKILTSSSGYTYKIQTNVGLLGDVPVPGNYNNDNITDFAVIRRGNGVDPFDSQIYWKWCNVYSNCDSNSLAWGYLPLTTI